MRNPIPNSTPCLHLPFILSCILILFSFRFMGGNSTKATSGINGAGTQSQQDLGIPDSAKLFFEDTKKSVRAPVPYRGMKC